MAASARAPTIRAAIGAPTRCCHPTRSPRAICTSTASIAAPGPGKSSCGRGWKNSRKPSHRIAFGLARQAAMGIEQALAPGGDRIIGLEQMRRADRTRPLERAEQDVVGIFGRIAAQVGLLLHGQACRLQRLAERGELSLAVLHDRLERGAEEL